MKLKRLALTGAKTAVQFEDTKCSKFLVKNFGSGDVYVSFAADTADADSIKIPKETGQICVDNEFYEDKVTKHNFDTIYVKGTGEVEVQCITYYEVEA